MKRLRMVLVVVLTLVLLALALWWSPRQSRYATPTACLDIYCEASKTGDVAKYRSCLGEPLRSEMERRYPDGSAWAEAVRATMTDIKSWVQMDPVIDGATAYVDVEEVHRSGQRRRRFHLAQAGSGWLISGIEPPKEVPAIIPYGTHVSQVSEEPR